MRLKRPGGPQRRARPAGRIKDGVALPHNHPEEMLQHRYRLLILVQALAHRPNKEIRARLLKYSAASTTKKCFFLRLVRIIPGVADHPSIRLAPGQREWIDPVEILL